MDMFNIYLPIAGMEFNVLLLLLIGFTVGVCGGFFGIGGAWIVTPALNIFGFPMPYAIGTDLAHMGGKSIVSTIRHGKFGNVDIRLGISMIIGTTLGMELGARLVMYLERIGLAESMIRKLYIVFLAFIGSYVLYDYIKYTRRAKTAAVGTSSGSPGNQETLAQRLQRMRIPPMIHFKASGITCSMWLPVFVGFVTGVVASVLGVGGGFIRMPALIYLIGCPTAIAVGTDLFAVLFAGAYGCFTYALKGVVEIVAAIYMLIGASIGAQIGVTAVKYIRGYGIRLLFAIMIIMAGVSVLLKQLQMVTAAGLVVMGAALAMCGIIMARLWIGFKKEKAEKMGLGH